MECNCELFAIPSTLRLQQPTVLPFVLLALVNEASSAVLQNQVHLGLLTVNDDLVKFGDVLMLHFFKDGHFVANKHTRQRLLLCRFFLVLLLVRRTVDHLAVFLEQ